MHSVSLHNALDLAKKSNKNVFIDTYADWCIPCKKMEIEFLNSEVSSFFNQNYVNIRINMDNSVYAGSYRNEFDIVFLPTMIILDQEGHVKYKTDKIIPGRELMAIASQSLNPDVFFESDASKIISSPVVGNVTKKKETKQGSRVVYSANEDGSKVNPDFLYQEAYFRLELMDGSHKSSVKEYLATQKDLSTPKNIKFIFDFLDNTSTNEFKYFVKNLPLFKREIGRENVELTLRFLIMDRLEFGFPRPNLEEAKVLYRLIDSTFYEEKAYKYYLSRLIDDCNYQEYKRLGKEYLNKFDSKDHLVIFTMAEESLSTDDWISDSKIEQSILMVKKAIKINDSIQSYHIALAELYLKLDKEKKAKKVIKKAIKIAKSNNQNTKMLDNMIIRLDNRI